MRIIFILMLSIAFTLNAFCQPNLILPEDRKMIESVGDELNRAYYFEALDHLNILIGRYPGEGYLRMLKGVTEERYKGITAYKWPGNLGSSEIFCQSHFNSNTQSYSA